MPKLKTHKSTAKRFKRTGTGKLMRQNMPKGHLRRRHAKRNNRKLDRYVPVALHEGKPIGVQLIAGRYREDLALDAAAAIEKRAGTLVPRLWEKMA